MVQMQRRGGRVHRPTQWDPGNLLGYPRAADGKRDSAGTESRVCFGAW